MKSCLLGKLIGIKLLKFLSLEFSCLLISNFLERFLICLFVMNSLHYNNINHSIYFTYLGYPGSFSSTGVCQYNFQASPGKQNCLIKTNKCTTFKQK